MRNALAAELLKLRTTRTLIWLALAMLGLVALAVTLHALGLPAVGLNRADSQTRVLMAGENIGAVFAALLGAMTMTAEVRHGTIKSTFLGTPDRRLVMYAKAVTSGVLGLALGLLACSVAYFLGAGLLRSRGVDFLLSSADFAQFVLGGAVAAAGWSLLGLAVGCLVRNQVGAVVGLFVWLTIVENLLIDSVPGFSRYMPGALGQALAGGIQGTLASPWLALGLLVLYAAAALVLGTERTSRTDVA
jgi:ABC-2 type transport system permease protein